MTKRKKGEEADDVAAMLEELRLLRASDRDSEARQKELKEELLPLMADLGQFWYIDSAGAKRRAFYSDAEIRYVDVEELESAVDAGAISETVLDEVAPRKVDLDAWDTAVKAGRIPPSVVRKTLTIQKGRKTVKYDDPTPEVTEDD